MIIWLSSYPRSGNTFLRTLLKNCLGQDTYSIYNDNDIGGDPALTEVTGHRTLKHCFGSSEFDLTPLRASDELFFLKTHDPKRTLVGRGDKVIYIIRDGREATFSFHKYLLDFYDKEVSTLELSLGFEFPDGSWSDHVAGWEPKEQADTLLLHFEEVTAKPRDAVDQIAAFAGIQSVEYRIPEFNDLQKIDARFFRKGKRKSFIEEVSKDAEILFWIRSFREMRDYGYMEASPAFVNDLSEDVLLMMGEGMLQGVSYARRLQSQLATELNNSIGQVRELRENVDSQRELIERKDERINNQGELIERKDEWINNQRELFERKDEWINNQRVLIERKDERINNQRELIESKDEWINNQRELIERKDEWINNQRELIERKDERIKSQCEVIEQKILQLQKYSNQIRRKSQKMVKLQGELSDSRGTLVLIRKSWSWKLTTPLRVMRHFFNGNSRDLADGERERKRKK